MTRDKFVTSKRSLPLTWICGGGRSHVAHRTHTAISSSDCEVKSKKRPNTVIYGGDSDALVSEERSRVTIVLAEADTCQWEGEQERGRYINKNKVDTTTKAKIAIQV